LERFVSGFGPKWGHFGHIEASFGSGFFEFAFFCDFLRFCDEIEAKELTEVDREHVELERWVMGKHVWEREGVM